MSGQVRNLVPYFVPGQGDTVNESLSQYATTPSKSSPPRLSVNVRKWDHAEGYFKDAVHVIHDHHPQAPRLQPVATQTQTETQTQTDTQTQTPRLLTPAEIRQAREQKVQASSPPRNDQSNKSPRNINQLNPSPKSSPPRTSTSPNEKAKHTTSPPAKPRPFAGSTFEAASPPPSGLPIPGFVKSRTTSEIQSDTPHDREQAAVNLKRILRI